MTLAVGQRVGAYEILGSLGAGGMGEVYRARDTRLNRDVALKVLPDVFAADPDRLARFKREAQLLASLNHPNIAAIHGFEEQTAVVSGFSRTVEALVLELVEGPTLADRIAQGPLPLDEALPIARQIAEALETAHEHGVIHRDLKPANIKVRPDGTVKVLDFGLAKAFEGDVRTPDVSQSPTLSVAATHMGVILGTAAYMAPEQARGKQVDKRADIWAFGAVLYEMLTGRQAFEGEDASEILASVIKGMADFSLLPAHIDPRLRRVIRRCLEKDVRKRFRDIGDVRNELDEIHANPEQPSAAVAGEGRSGPRRMLPWIAAAMALTALVVGAVVWTLKPAADATPGAPTRFVHTLGPQQFFRNTGRPVVAISRDGRQFVYNIATSVSNTGGLYLRAMDGLDARLIPGTEEPLTNPFFSPDGQWVGFYSNTQLRKIPVTGGTGVAVAKAVNPYGASWTADDSILFGQPEGIMRVSANGGTPEVLVATEKDEQAHGPQLLPGGEWVLFSLTRGSGTSRWDEAEIVAQSLRSGERKVLWRGGSDARYIETGHLVYALGDALFALPFDLARMQVSGGPVPVMTGLQRVLNPGANTATAHYDVSAAGTLVHVSGGSNTLVARTLVWIDRNGRQEPIPAPPRAYVYPRISPDGTRLAVHIGEQENDIWIWSFERQTLTRLTFDPGLDTFPVWTPDGRRIVFASARGGTFGNVYWQAADGTGDPERLTESQNPQSPTSISPDGTQLVLDEASQPAGYDILLLTLAGERKIAKLVGTMFGERSAALSSDGRWLAYESAESGRYEIYVRPFPAVGGGRWQVSTDGGGQPLWSPDSRELYFVEPGRGLAAVPIQPGAGFVAGNRRLIAEGAVLGLQGFVGRMYDISPDGRRFVAIKIGEGGEDAASPRQIVVIENWFDELKRLAPTN